MCTRSTKLPKSARACDRGEAIAAHLMTTGIACSSAVGSWSYFKFRRSTYCLIHGYLEEHLSSMLYRSVFIQIIVAFI